MGFISLSFRNSHSLSQKIQKLQQQFNHDASILHSSNTNFCPFSIVFETEFHLNSERYAYLCFLSAGIKACAEIINFVFKFSQFV